MGGVDDEEYGAECHALVDTLGVRDLIFTGRVNVVEYMEKLDFTILTSISEGQPLSVLGVACSASSLRDDRGGLLP